MPITTRDDDLAASDFSGMTVYDDDLGVHLMGITTIADGGTGRNKTADGPGPVVQLSAAANLTTLPVAIGELMVGGASGVPTAFASNNTATRKFLMQVAVIAGTPVFAWVQIAATDIASGQLSQAQGGTGADLSGSGPGLLYKSNAFAAVSVMTTPTFTELFINAGAASGSRSNILADQNQTAVLRFADRNAGTSYWDCYHLIGAGSALGNFAIRHNSTITPAISVDPSNNVGVGGASTFGAGAAGVLALTNGTAPTTSPADTVQLFSVDLSAGNATLGLRTETAVATESVTSDRTLSVKINGTTYKVCLKA